MSGDYLHIRPGDAARGCDVHKWPTEGMARRLIDAMRATHGKGGINACRECISRARDTLPCRRCGATGPERMCPDCPDWKASR
jgi:hypothetical protein